MATTGDCCDGSDEYDGTVVCPNTCIMGGNIVYQRINYDSVASNMDALNSKKTKHGIKMVDAIHKPSGLKALVFVQMSLVIVLRINLMLKLVVFFFIFPQWFEVLDGLLGKHWRNVGLAFNCTFLLFGSVIQLIACASNIYYINDNLDQRKFGLFLAC
ncbi:hypothetical protein OROMI_021070 [Orobanche minor]